MSSYWLQYMVITHKGIVKYIMYMVLGSVFYDASMQAPGVDLGMAQRGVLTPSPVISEISLVEL